jgi:broad specificity phosphatase PhoE
MSTEPEILPLETLKESYPRLETSYQSHFIPKYPETQEQLNLRVSSTVKHLVNNFSEDILIIGHSLSVIGSAKTLVPDIPEIKAGFCCLIQIQCSTQGWRLINSVEKN